MARTFVQQSQIRDSEEKLDNVAVADLASTTDLAGDLNALRSQAKRILGSSDWFSDLSAPTALGDTGTARGLNTISTDLFEVERKRVLVNVTSLTDVAVPASQNYVVLSAAQIPGAVAPASNPIAAVGITNVAGYVAASITLGSHSMTEVAGSTAIAPKNLVEIVDGDTRDQILSSNRVVYALFQTNLSSGSTIAGSDVQLSFVRINSAGNGLEAVPSADIAGKTINYAIPYRKALEDLNEQDFLRGAILDNAGSTTSNLQVAYDNQGATPVNVTTNSYLDLEGPGLQWIIRDDTEAALLTVLEGSATSNSKVEVNAATDLFKSSALANEFVEGVTVDSGGTSIQLGVTAGQIATTGVADLTVIGAGELFLDDGNRAGSTFSTALKLADTTAEWSAFESAYGGELSLLAALTAAKNSNVRGTKTFVDVASPVLADTDFTTGVDMSTGTFTTGYDVYLNGNLLRAGANSSANNDYYPGTSLATGQLKFEFPLRVGDVVCVVPYVGA